MGDDYPVRGNVVRLWYEGSLDATGFYDLMRREGSAVSRGGTNAASQVHGVFYWDGAVVTIGGIHLTSRRNVGYIEMQRDGDIDELYELAKKVEKEIKGKLKMQTVSKDEG